jgi:hypothetical protein
MNEKKENAISGFERLPKLPHGMNLDAQMGTIPGDESEKKLSFSEGLRGREEQKKYTEDEKTKELVEQLGEYEQEIYEKDRLIQNLQNEIDLQKEKKFEK